MSAAGRDLAAAFHRDCCRAHFAKRARLTGIEIHVARIERMLERARPAFERPGIDRYPVTLRRTKERLTVVYDTTLHCVVTCWREGRR